MATHASAETKRAAVQYKAEGQRSTWIAKELGVGVSSVNRWYRRWKRRMRIRRVWQKDAGGPLVSRILDLDKKKYVGGDFNTNEEAEAAVYAFL